MWHYIKGILIGLFLLWLVFFISFTISDGFILASIFSVTLLKAVFNMFQRYTGGTGLWIVLFIILSSWIWNFGKKRRPKVNKEYSKSNCPQETIHQATEQEDEKIEP